MEFRILGPVEVWDGGRRIVIAGDRQRALLAVLLLNANRVVSNEQLIDALWGDEPPATGAKAAQVRVSQLRRALEDRGADHSLIATRGGGYVVEVEPDQLDLLRFERLASEADREIAKPDASAAAALLSEALALWRGAPLADVDAPFATQAAARLEELRFAAVERRIDADLELGRHVDVVGELHDLIAANPYRERLRAQLMLALYRSGRQAEALAAYRDTARLFVDELGIEPGQPLQQLEAAILRQDADLEGRQVSAPAARADVATDRASTDRSILVVPDDLEALAGLLAVAEPLMLRPQRELVVVAVVEHPDDLHEVTAQLESRRRSLLARDVQVRVAVFTSTDRTADLLRLAPEQRSDLLLLEAPPELLATGDPPSELDALWHRLSCDVAVLARAADRDLSFADGRPIVVPFGGGEHEWAALEIGAWIAAAYDLPLRLLGSTSRPERGKRDASRLLAGVSLIVQRAAGIAAEPMLAPPGEASALATASGAALMVVGVSERWAEEGLGATRVALARSPECSTLLVRRGEQPGALSPLERLTRYTWSVPDRGA